MKYLILFSGKNKKKYFKMSSAQNFAQSAKRLLLKKFFPLPAHVFIILLDE